MILSFIIICYNNPNELDKTLKSLISVCSFSNKFEIIVIDGSTNNDCATISENHEQLIHKYIKGPDKGKYDAMNKGLLLAQGEFVTFLNSGDVYASTIPQTDLISILKKYKTEKYILYFDTILCYEDYSVRLRAGYQEDLRLNSSSPKLPIHQSIVYPLEILKGKSFNVKLRYSADTDFNLSLFRAHKSKYIPMTFSHFSLGGASNYKQSVMEVLRHSLEHAKVTEKKLIEISILLSKEFIKYLIIKVIGFRRYARYTIKRQS